MKRFTHIILFCSVTIYSIFAISSETDTVQEDLYQSLIGLFFDATRIGNGEVINEFLDAGFPINQRNYKSYTALMVAAYQGQREIVQLLLARGANACLQDKRGNTALMGALLKREIGIAKDLYQADCPSDLLNKAGLDLKQFAEIYGQSEVLKSLAKQQPITSISSGGK
ncbi:ankyrin repeat domain-containing protein [Vibrio vulnificus]|uniref:ankyrin repeat domain-containing protein n=1 Tax=Vibrio vulnificus TaxID=672 RepID=UPI001CDBC2EA|nr:ankyrin repeat domain-containing protein [Vibrio vulnificus]MCA3911203.1 ankyrin repeat domain-containing protein [Vibrio vulnificus]